MSAVFQGVEYPSVEAAAAVAVATWLGDYSLTLDDEGQGEIRGMSAWREPITACEVVEEILENWTVDAELAAALHDAVRGAAAAADRIRSSELTVDQAVDLIEAAGMRVWRGGDHARVYMNRYNGHYDVVAIVRDINAGQYDTGNSGIEGKPRARERRMICQALFGRDHVYGATPEYVGPES